MGPAPRFSFYIFFRSFGHLLQLLAEKNSFLYLPDRIEEKRILRKIQSCLALFSVLVKRR
jgi:hypothetical protein